MIKYASNSLLATMISFTNEIANLCAKAGVDVTDVVDHGWCKSIYFRDPNKLQLEYCCFSGELRADLNDDRASAGWEALARS